MLTKYISFHIFIISFIIGIIIVYLHNPIKEVIFVYPTPYNNKQIEYKDKSDNCFMFNHEEVECPLDKSKIKSIPMQYTKN